MTEFFSEDIDFNVRSIDRFKPWIEQVIQQEEHIPGDINYIFTSDAKLLTLNQEYLNHNTFTDILTFDQSIDPLTISGDIYISIERVKANALIFKQPFETELKRVMVHGLLHLLGYDDHTSEEKTEMRKKEEAYLSL